MLPDFKLVPEGTLLLPGDFKICLEGWELEDLGSFPLFLGP